MFTFNNIIIIVILILYTLYVVTCFVIGHFMIYGRLEKDWNDLFVKNLLFLL